MERLRTQLGVSLIELLVALAILSVALVPLLSVFVHALKMAEHANKRTIALNLARDLQEEIRSKAFTEPDPPDPPAGSQYYPNGTTQMPFGLDTASPGADGYSASATRELLDDVDDYNGWCRGRDCEFCAGVNDLCIDETPLEAFDGTRYSGQGYPHYEWFTRRVDVYNIFQHVSTVRGKDPLRHTMPMGVGDYRDDEFFNFYDLREEYLTTLTTDPTAGNRPATGRSRLKVVRVIVEYNGPVTPPINIEDTSLVVLPISKEIEQ